MTDLFPGKSKDDMLKQYKKLAKQADQRLVRLEAYAHDTGFKTATQWAYKRAIKDIESRFGEGSKRFNRNIQNLNKNQIQAMISDVKTFLEAPSSTKKGIITVYQQKADTVNERYGTSFTWQELAEYYTSGMADKLSEKFGSATALKQIAKHMRNKDKIVADIKKANGKTTRVTKDMVKNEIYKRLEEQKLSIKDLF